MNRLFALVLLAAISTGGYHVYATSRKDKAIADGSYTCEGCLSPAQSAAYARYSRGEGPEPKFARDSVTVPAAPALPQPSTVQAASTVAGADAEPSQPAMQTPSAPEEPAPAVSTPAADSIPPNPPNGTRFGSASGPYQWYRQGNLTWRINTETGRSCIIYATLQEWRKRIVMAHGCGNRA